MANFKCHKCGIIESRGNNNKLVCEVIRGISPDYKAGIAATLDQYTVYCRSCFYINIYQPGWIGNLKFHSYMGGKEFFEAFKNYDLFQLYNPINKAMLDDGVIPKGWTPFDD